MRVIKRADIEMLRFTMKPFNGNLRFWWFLVGRVTLFNATVFLYQQQQNSPQFRKSACFAILSKVYLP